MRTATVNVYQFSELSENAKETARNWYRNATAGESWWGVIYDDAAEIGLKLSGFDIDYGRVPYATGSLTGTHCETAEKIVASHGEQCKTHEIATAFRKARHAIVAASAIAEQDAFRAGTESEFDIEGKLETLESEFLRDLLADYCRQLRVQCDYNETEECIDGDIEANEYEFTENGKRFVE